MKRIFAFLALVLAGFLIQAHLSPLFADDGQDLYRLGRYTEAADAWTKAAQNGDVEAGYRLGKLYIDGTVIGRDYAKAAKILKVSALGGHAQAQLEYAMLLDNGWGVPRSRAQAAKFYLKAAQCGVPAAMFNIGAMLENGEGVKADVIQAFKWYRLAYDAGLDPIVAGPMNILAERMKPAELHRALDLARDFKAVDTSPKQMN